VSLNRTIDSVIDVRESNLGQDNYIIFQGVGGVPPCCPGIAGDKD
jgi:hypothetical protein